MKITRFYEYDNGKEAGWAIGTSDGSLLLVTIDKGGPLDVAGCGCEPRHPDIIGAELKRWNHYRKPFDNELVLALETSKGDVKLSVQRLKLEVGSPTLTARISLEYQV